jgi:hypothetical protein
VGAQEATQWQWQLQGQLDLSAEAPVYGVDGVQTKAARVAALHSKAPRVIC